MGRSLTCRCAICDKNCSALSLKSCQSSVRDFFCNIHHFRHNFIWYLWYYLIMGFCKQQEMAGVGGVNIKFNCKISILVDFLRINLPLGNLAEYALLGGIHMEKILSVFIIFY